MQKIILQTEIANFVIGLADSIHTTRARKTQFKVNVAGDDWIFTPLSSGKPRKEPASNLAKTIAYFNTTKSLTPKDYHDVTFNSVYILALIEKYLKSLAE
jgi:hypothetical protein